MVRRAGGVNCKLIVGEMMEVVRTDKASRRPRPESDHSVGNDATVLVPVSAEAKRVGLYLHPDDYRELGLAKVEDGAGSNTRVRAMIAYWRSDGRFRRAVDALASSSNHVP